MKIKREEERENGKEEERARANQDNRLAEGGEVQLLEDRINAPAAHAP